MMRGLLKIMILLGLITAARSEGDLAAERRQQPRLRAQGGVAEIDPRVLAAMEKVPHHEFVPREEAAAAYKNRPLPIGQGQTISQPFIVALMT